MALATTFPFGEFLILLGDGASPENFADPCGLTSKGFTRTANMNDTNIPGCDDPDAAAWLGRDAISYQGAISGEGVVAEESIVTFEDWWASGQTVAKNVRIEVGAHAWEGPFKLAEYNITGERGSKVTLSISLVSDGEIQRVST